MVELASLLLVDSVNHRDELTVTAPPTVLLAFLPPGAVPSLVRGLSLGLVLVFAEDCPDGLLIGGMACSEVEQLPCCSWFAVSKLMDEGFVSHARDECSDHVYIYDVGKLISLHGKAMDVLT